MSDATYQPKIYKTDNGDELVVNGGKITENGTQASNISDVTTDYSTGDLDTEAELIAAINANGTAINAIIAALEGVGILADS